MYHIALCDDDSIFMEKMHRIVEGNPEHDESMVCSTFSSGMELVKSDIAQLDLLIIDMQMEQVDGFTAAKQVRKKNKDAVIAFCSGVVMPSPEHFEVQPYRYIVKKIDTTEIEKIVTDLLLEMKERKAKKTKKVVEVVSAGKACRIDPSDILYVSREKRTSVLVVEMHSGKAEGYVTYEEIESNEKLTDWYTQLAEYGFEFAHTSYIVNLQKIHSVMKDDIYMSNGEVLHISRTCKQKFHEKFSYYFSKKYRRGTEK